MQGIFMYSADGVLRALDSAIAIGLAQKAEAEKAEIFRTIIEDVNEGIIATNQQGIITVFNPSAEKITGLASRKVTGQLAKDVISGSRLHEVLATGESELNQIQVIGEAKVVTNRIPIVTKGEITGVVATFQHIDVIQKAEEKIRLRLSERGFLAKHTFSDVIHRSERMSEVIREAQHYAKSDSTILILGESGVGKEIFAQAIHNESRRSHGPFVAINCAALPPNLLESELFGYEEGAFTGAKKGGKAGLFELSRGGSIFLDEIAEIPRSIQSRLLRVLQERAVLRVGGERIIPVNIRVIAATNKKLWDMVQAGRFRQDLYYRVCVLELTIPPLRQRREDISLLVANLLEEYREDMHPAVRKEIAENPRLLHYCWEGNIRELRNMVERIAVLYRTGTDTDRLLQMILGDRNELSKSSRTEKEEIQQMLAATKGNKTVAAQKLGISRTTLWRKLQE